MATDFNVKNSFLHIILYLENKYKCHTRNTLFYKIYQFKTIWIKRKINYRQFFFYKLISDFCIFSGYQH